MQAGNGGLGLGVVTHFHKTKTFGAASVAFHHDFGAGDRTELAERLLQVVVAHRVRQIAYVEFVAHAKDS